MKTLENTQIFLVKILENTQILNNTTVVLFSEFTHIRDYRIAQIHTYPRLSDGANIHISAIISKEKPVF